MTTPTGRVLGRPLRRLEDPRLITGRGQYVDDLRMEGMLHVAFVRSPEAHATVDSIDVIDAAGLEGVVAVMTAADLGLDGPMPNAHPHPAITEPRQTSPLATEEVCYVGQPVAVVVAESRAVAADAAELVWVDYTALPAVADLERAAASDAHRVISSTSDNVVASVSSRFGDADEVFSKAEVRFELRLRQHRGACAAMEPRGVVAVKDPEGVTVWTSSQAPYSVKKHVAAYLGLTNLRVIAPDVGGGFGPKGMVYPEEFVLTALADRLGVPVKWIESRREHFLTVNQQRDMIADLEVAAGADGKLRGLRGRILHDNGAYVPYGLVLHMTGLQLIQGPYTLDAMDITLDAIATNAVPTSPIRGAARPNAVFIIERVMDAIAARTGVDRFEIRRRNFIQADRFPYEYPIPARYGGNLTYDSGDYVAALEAVSELADLAGFEERRIRALAEGRRLGLGVAAYVEDTGLGPHEQARVEIGVDGSVTMITGAGSQGQGHATVFAQICAEALGVDPGDVIIRSADTDLPGTGIPTVASRTAVTAGASTAIAAEGVADLLRKLAADHLEAAAADLVMEGGSVRVAGSPGAEVTFAELASIGAERGVALAVSEAHPAARPPYAFGCHIAEVEVDEETGLVKVLKYSVAHDCGTILNPMIVNGQIDGGVVHGLSNALLERVVYSEEGQPLTTTFMDFRIPTAVDVPAVSKVHTVTPTADNPLGAKGAGEGGTLPAMAVVASAVEDALRDLDVWIDQYPLSPQVVRRLLAAKLHP